MMSAFDLTTRKAAWYILSVVSVCQTVTFINVKNKVYKKTVIGDVVAHLKPQNITVSLDL